MSVCVFFLCVNLQKQKGRTTKSDKRMFLSAKTNFIYAIDMDISEYHLMFNRAVHMKQQTRPYYICMYLFALTSIPYHTISFNINSFYRHIIIKCIHK